MLYLDRPICTVGKHDAGNIYVLVLGLFWAMNLLFQTINKYKETFNTCCITKSNKNEDTIYKTHKTNKLNKSTEKALFGR